jgi:hypothetical protein
VATLFFLLFYSITSSGCRFVVAFDYLNHNATVVTARRAFNRFCFRNVKMRAVKTCLLRLFTPSRAWLSVVGRSGTMVPLPMLSITSALGVRFAE